MLVFLVLIDIITLFPESFFGPFDTSIVARARNRGLVEIRTVNLRDFASDARGTVDDKPYGGGPGMLLKPEPVFAALEKLRTKNSTVLLTSPQGERFEQRIAKDLSLEEHVIIICGQYEGFDERIRSFADREISIGDYVMTGGNLAAMVIVDAAVRLIPGVLGSESSEIEESFSGKLLEYPQYTRPPDFRGLKVPDILLSGNHKEIANWREREARKRTEIRRPDLLDKN